MTDQPCMTLLITDVTEMGAGNYCVAGWCAEQNRMVRPLPNGVNWPRSLLRSSGVAPGATVRVQPITKTLMSAYPHRTEDTPVDPSGIQVISSDPGPWFGPNAPPTALTLEEAFESQITYNSEWNNCRQGVHVPAGAKVRSLWAIRVTRDRLRFTEDFGKLKAILDDGSAKYKLAISSKALKESWRDGGLTLVAKALPASGDLHIRVGLARAWGEQPDKCYVMINGVY